MENNKEDTTLDTNNQVMDNKVDIAEENTDEKAKEKAEEQAVEQAEEKTEEKKENTKDTIEETKEEEKQKEESTEEKNEEQKAANASLYIEEPFIDPSVYRNKRKKRIGRRIAVISISVVLIVYFAGVFFHMNHFGTMTQINGFDVSGKPIEEVDRILHTDASKYTLTIQFKKEDFTMKVGDAGSTVKFKESVKSVANKRSPFLWIVDLFYSYDYKIDYMIACDRNDLKEYLSTCKSMDESTMEEPLDAYVTMEDGEVVVHPEQTGTRLDMERVYDKVLDAMKQYKQELNMEEELCYMIAHITTESESIQNTVKEAEEYLSIEACYDFGDYIYQIPREELSKMAFVDSKGHVKISESNVTGYANRFAKKFSTAYTDREFTTHDGKKIQVYGGYFGWVINADEEAAELYSYMKQKKSFTKEPVCERRGYAMCEENDIGYRYIEVDLSDQHVYYYEKGKKVWDSECVTGHTPGHTTPGGLYGITYKKLNAILRGEDYETKVTYWMPFNGGIGLHDASWRREFGGEIYKRDGSHGCVNLPPAKAAELFEYVEEGMPVVCYWESEP